MQSIRRARALLATLAAALMLGFAGNVYAGADNPSQGKGAPDCKANPDDPRCRGTK